MWKKWKRVDWITILDCVTAVVDVADVDIVDVAVVAAVVVKCGQSIVKPEVKIVNFYYVDKVHLMTSFKDDHKARTNI